MSDGTINPTQPVFGMTFRTKGEAEAEAGRPR